MALAEEMRRLTDGLRQAHGGRLEAVATLRSDAARYLTDQWSARRHMASVLRRDLDEASTARRAADHDRRVQTAHAARQRAAYLRSVRSSVASMRADTASALTGLRNDFAAAHRLWTELGLSTGRARAAAAARSAVGSPAEATEAEPPSERVVRYLDEHPTGQALGELQKALGVPRRQLARLMDQLVEARKVRQNKQGFYVPPAALKTEP